MTGRMRRLTFIVLVGVVLISGGIGLRLADTAHAADNTRWVNSLTYGSVGGGFYWDSASGQVWTSERGWHAYSPEVPGPSPLWVNDLTYGSEGGGFYWEPKSGQVWTAERGWHNFSPGGTSKATPTPTPKPTKVPDGATRSTALPRGYATNVGDWIVQVNEVTPDATAKILSANKYNTRPASSSWQTSLCATKARAQGVPSG